MIFQDLIQICKHKYIICRYLTFFLLTNHNFFLKHINVESTSFYPSKLCPSFHSTIRIQKLSRWKSIWQSLDYNEIIFITGKIIMLQNHISPDWNFQTKQKMMKLIRLKESFYHNLNISRWDVFAYINSLFKWLHIYDEDCDRSVHKNKTLDFQGNDSHTRCKIYISDPWHVT